MRENLIFPSLTISKFIKCYQFRKTLLLAKNQTCKRQAISELIRYGKKSNCALNIEFLEIFEFEKWIETIYDNLIFLNPNSFLPLYRLTNFESECIWMQVISETKNYKLDVWKLAKLAMEANSLLQDWNIAVPKEFRTREYEVFSAWKTLYENRLKLAKAADFNIIFSHVLSSLQEGVNLDFPEYIFLYGFSEFSEKLTLFLQVISSRIVKLFLLNKDTQNLTRKNKIVRYEFSDRVSEWKSAAQWVEKKLKRSKKARYAIVSSNLKKDIFLGQRIVNQCFLQSKKKFSFFSDVGISVKSMKVFHPIRAASFWLLALAKSSTEKSCETEIYGKAILSGCCYGDFYNSEKHLNIDLDLRRIGKEKLSVLEWLDLLEQSPKLLAGWKSAQSFWNKMRGYGRLNEWSYIMEKSLISIGFPGEKKFDSISLNSIEKINELFREFSALTSIFGKLSGISAVKLFEKLVENSLFSHEQFLTNRLDLLDLSEIRGRSWNGMWILGLSNDSFQLKNESNPFIPVPVLQKSSIPRGTYELESAWSDQFYKSAIQNVPEIIISCSRMENSSRLEPSSIISNYPISKQKKSFPRKLNLVQEFIEEETVPELSISEVDHIKDNILEILNIQSKNPLWAFARYRLGIKQMPDYSERTMQNSIRGNFLHKSLELIWKSIRNHERLCNLLDRNDFESILEGYIDQAARLELNSYPSVLRELEFERAKRILSKWLRLESYRIPFSVKEIEKTFSWKFNSIEFKVRIDRIDCLINGDSLVIDYKTGKNISSNLESDWIKMRPINIQLPFYAVVLYQQGLIRADSYALVLAKINEVVRRTEGLATSKTGIEGIELFEKSNFFKSLDHEEIMSYWISSIDRFANEFTSGMAANFFSCKRDLGFCDILPFLRIKNVS